MKIPYKPPKVKPNKNKMNTPLPQWNDAINDLEKYKLSSSEVLKKKIKYVSKNLEVAKKDLSDQIQHKSQIKEKIKEKEYSDNITNNNYYQPKQNNLEYNYKSVERSNSQNNIKNKNKSMTSIDFKNKKNMIKSSQNKNKIKFVNNFNEFNINPNLIQNDIENEFQIQMINNPFSIKVNSTKIENSINKSGDNLKNMNKNKFLLDDDLNEKLRKLEENLLRGEVKNENYKIKSYDDDEIINNRSESTSPKNYKKINNFEDNTYNTNCENINYLNNDLNKKFDNLTDLEEGMKKLNDILDFSSKSSLKFKIDHENESNNLDYENKNKIFENNKNKIGKNNISDTYDNPTKIIFNPKSIETTKCRKIIDMDNKSDMYAINKYNFNEEKDEKLDYLKDLLLKTKSDLDNFNTKLESDTNENNYNNSNIFANNNKNKNWVYEEDELEPRAPPNVSTGYRKII